MSVDKEQRRSRRLMLSLCFVFKELLGVIKWRRNLEKDKRNIFQLFTETSFQKTAGFKTERSLYKSQIRWHHRFSRCRNDLLKYQGVSWIILFETTDLKKLKQDWIMSPQIFFWVTVVELFEGLFLPRFLGFRKSKKT